MQGIAGTRRAIRAMLPRTAEGTNRPPAGDPLVAHDLDPGGDRDARLARHGRHCLRMRLPDADSRVRLRPFPFRVKAGRTYRVSVCGGGRRGLA